MWYDGPRIKKNEHKIPNLIHPTVKIRSDTKLGSGIVLFERAAIGYNIKIGNNVWVDAHVLLGHDVLIRNYTSIMPSSVVGGNCKIGELCIIGAGANIHPGMVIGNNSTVGIATTIIKNVPENTSVINFPRNVVRKK